MFNPYKTAPRRFRSCLHRDGEVLLTAHLVAGSPCLFSVSMSSSTGAQCSLSCPKGLAWATQAPCEGPALPSSHGRQTGHPGCCRLCKLPVARAAGQRLQPVRASTPAKSVIRYASFSKPPNPFMSMAAANFLLFVPFAD